MLSKSQKMSFVEEGKAQLGKYSVVGIVSLNGIPDRLLQSTRNRLKANVRFILGRKTLLQMILESGERTKHIAKDVSGTSAIILSNDDPFELYRSFKAGAIKLAAKPNQVAPDDVTVPAGDTNVQPGQTVTELKTAGIDVQIQKGKVVIARDKVVAKKGEVITGPVAKALRVLDIMPFSATLEPALLVAGSMTFTRSVLGIDAQKTTAGIIVAFNSALALSMDRGIVNAYTIKALIAKAYAGAHHLGVQAKVPDSGIMESLLSKAAQEATALNSLAEKKP